MGELKKKAYTCLVAHYYGDYHNSIKKDKPIKVINYQDFKEHIQDFNFFCKYMHLRQFNSLEYSQEEQDIISKKMVVIMEKYNLKPKAYLENWEVEEVSLAIFGDFENGK